LAKPTNALSWGRKPAAFTKLNELLAPGEESSGRPAFNDSVLSRHIVSKRVRIGYKQLANVIDYEVTFTVPEGERHTYAQFEALTGYMPADHIKTSRTTRPWTSVNR
jgi:hypothetical protein